MKSTNTVASLKSDLKKYATPEKALIYQKFFKTGPGEYGEGDRFLGITMPNIRLNVKKYYKNISISQLDRLISSKFHEERMAALLILVEKYQKGDKPEKKYIYDYYLDNTKYINNWDFVDVTSHKIVGDYLLNKDRKILYQLAKSKDLWERRISIISTMTFIRNNQFKDTLAISKLLIKDNHDLIHKAVGWMLREVGKRDRAVEEKFLKANYQSMPRTMLRYSIERFPEDLRQKYLKGTI